MCFMTSANNNDISNDGNSIQLIFGTEELAVLLLVELCAHPFARIEIYI